MLVLVSVVALEGLLRLLGGGPADTTDLDSMHVYSETYGWTPRPGFRHREDGKTISINGRGYRGAEYGSARRPGTLRILMLGDSIAFGLDVDDAETFSARLDSPRAGWEVVNLSVMGYGTDQALLKLEREGLAYGPDVVVLHFCLHNDFADNMLSRALYDGIHPKPYFTLEGDELRKHDAHLRTTLGGKAALFLQSNSRLYRGAAGMAASFTAQAAGSRERGQDLHWLDRMEQALQDLGRATEVTFRIIEAAGRLAAQRGARFIVMVHPDESAFRHQSRLTDKLRRTPRLEGATVIAMAEAYRSRNLRWEQFALDSLGHLSPTGHRLVAEVLREALSGRSAPPDVIDRMAANRRQGQ